MIIPNEVNAVTTDLRIDSDIIATEIPQTITTTAATVSSLIKSSIDALRTEAATIEAKRQNSFALTTETIISAERFHVLPIDNSIQVLQVSDLHYSFQVGIH